MHARELVELAAIVSANGPVLILGQGQVSSSGVEQYWAVSKCRLDRWGRALRRLGDQAADAKAAWPDAQWASIRALLEEVLLSEILTRTFTAVMSAYDRLRSTDVADPVVRSVLVGHLEARHRVLTLLVRGPGIDAGQALRLNRLRRRTERWTDLLIGHLTHVYDVSEFAFEPERAIDFAEDFHDQSQQPGGRHAWPLLFSSLRAAFQKGLAPVSPNADLNARIADSVLSCFRSELFDSTGKFRSLWMLRLSNAASDAEGMLENLLTPDPPSSKPPSFSARLRRPGQ